MPSDNALSVSDNGDKNTYEAKEIDEFCEISRISGLHGRKLKLRNFTSLFYSSHFSLISIDVRN